MNGTSGISNVSKVIIVAVIAAILIILVIVYGTQQGGQNAPVGTTLNNNSSSTSATVTAISPAGTGADTDAGDNTVNKISATSKSSGQTVSPAVPIAPAITFITPVAGDVWTIGNQNPIAWNIPPNVTGAISLLSAATGKSIGVILPEIGPKQTSYTWNTVGVYLNRTDPEETDVVPGNYKIEVSFDGNNLKQIVSPEFTIVN